MNWNSLRKEGLAFRDEEDMPEDSAPYSSISSREPLEDISMEGRANKLMSQDDGDDLSDFEGSGYDSPARSMRQSVMQKVSSRMPPQMANSSDPLMQQYDDKEAELQQIRGQQRESNAFTNFAQAASIAAQGANKPESTDSLYKNIASQNKDLLSSNEGDLERRQRVLNAIEARKSRESVAAENRLTRQAMLQQGNENRGHMQDIRTNRLLGKLVNDINHDPIVKPSEMNMASLVKSKAILDNPAVPLTSQVLSDAEQDIASALTLRGMGATEGKIQRTELVNMNRTIGEIKQKYGNTITDLRVQAPEVVAQIRKLNNALLDDYATTVNQRKNSVLDDFSNVYGDNPTFQEPISRLRAGFNKRSGIAVNPYASGGHSAGFITEANAGESEGPHGKSVKQNGVTYKWDGQKYVPGGE